MTNPVPIPLATLRRDQALHFGDPTRIATVRAFEDYDGVIVLWEIPTPNFEGADAKGPWFQIMLTVAAEAGSVAFLPGDKHVVLIDFKNGFVPTPANIVPYIRLYIANMSGAQPGKPPGVK